MITFCVVSANSFGNAGYFKESVVSLSVREVIEWHI